ncbi:MAG: hypothetical protein MJ109_03540 [Kiritimatiellae bacterium]|nr:hypothetical protein [Kiritimatiellia bacterium]
MPNFVERIASIGEEAVLQAQEYNLREKGIANVYCLNGLIIRQVVGNVSILNTKVARRPNFMDAIGIAKKYIPDIASTEMYMREMREGEE